MANSSGGVYGRPRRDDGEDDAAVEAAVEAAEGDRPAGADRISGRASVGGPGRTTGPVGRRRVAVTRGPA